MTPESWLTLWTAVLWGALGMFSALAVAVTIGGFVDIRKMLRQIRRQNADAAAAPDGREEKV